MTQIPGQPPFSPAARIRPTVVKLSSGLLVFLTVVLILSSVLGLIANNDDVRRATEEFQDIQGSGGGLSAGATAALTAITAMLFSAVFLVLAFLNLRGNRVSRLVTWILGGVGVVCCACGVFFQGASSALVGAAGEEQKDAYQKIVDAYPSWYQPTSIALSIVAILTLLAALILLALPPANEYFRKPAAPEWTPPAQQF